MTKTNRNACRNKYLKPIITNIQEFIECRKGLCQYKHSKNPLSIIYAKTLKAFPSNSLSLQSYKSVKYQATVARY
jgi:hypothetical protein